MKKNNGQPRPMYYHTRHIPERQLNLQTPTGAEVKANGLCDVMEEPFLSCMRDYRIDVVETRVVWWEIEKEPGVYDFSALEKDMETIRAKGFGVGVFPWFQHPPKWEKEIVRAKCLEHGEESSIVSLWDPRTLETYDRLYAAMAKALGDRIDFLYVCIYGDFGEPQYPHTTKHYLFSSPHAHFGLWCGDRLARADFRRYLEAKYGAIDALNRSWETELASFDEDLMVWRESVAFRMDFQQWYTDCLMEFTDKACAIARKHFPDTRLGLPIGCKSDCLCLGQTKSTVAKICAKYGITARCTTLADFDDFPRCNVVTRRIATAAQYYGADFGVESPLTLAESTAYNAVYQIISCNTALVHNDPGNIYRAKDVYFRFRDLPGALPFYCDYAVYYPVEEEKCMHPCGLSDFTLARNDGDFYPVALFDELAALRECTDYDIIDTVLIEDGFLNRRPKVVLTADVKVAARAAAALTAYAAEGGEVYHIADRPPTVLETGAPFPCGQAVESYAAFGSSPGRYVTNHGDLTSEYCEAAHTITLQG